MSHEKAISFFITLSFLFWVGKLAQFWLAQLAQNLCLDNFGFTFGENQREVHLISFSKDHLRANISDPDYRWKCWNLFKFYVTQL